MSAPETVAALAPSPAEAEAIMSAPVEQLTEDERRFRWQTLEARLEEADRVRGEHLAALQAFARRCFDVDAWRRSQEREQ